MTGLVDVSAFHDLGDFDFFHDDDLLYHRVSDEAVHHGKATTAACPMKQWEEGLSCDWSVVHTPQETAKGQTRYVLKISAGDCRKLGIEVRYCPVVEPDDPDYNLAHCLLFFPVKLQTKSEKRVLRDEFLRQSETLLLPPPSGEDSDR